MVQPIWIAIVIHLHGGGSKWQTMMVVVVSWRRGYLETWSLVGDQLGFLPCFCFRSVLRQEETATAS